MIQITPQMRIMVAVEPADFRKGIDGLARLCQEALGQDPMGGWVFVFRNRKATALKVLVYDGQGFWLCHGRNGADAYHGAEKIEVQHESLQPGDACPDCGDGTVYEMARPGVLVRITGQAPVAAKVYQLQKLRCHLCGKVFTAQSPPGVGTAKYDATAGSMIALLKYGSGMPFNRFEGLQGDLGIPLPASTQWDIVSGLAKQVEPAHAELLRQAGQGDVVYNDDTTIKILELMGKRARQNALAEDSAGGNAKKNNRTGLFTSGVVSTREGRRIALFFSGRKHAGENLTDVLARRAKVLAPPIQMCDALCVPDVVTSRPMAWRRLVDNVL